MRVSMGERERERERERGELISRQVRQERSAQETESGTQRQTVCVLLQRVGLLLGSARISQQVRDGRFVSE